MFAHQERAGGVKDTSGGSDNRAGPYLRKTQMLTSPPERAGDTVSPPYVALPPSFTALLALLLFLPPSPSPTRWSLRKPPLPRPPRPPSPFPPPTRRSLRKPPDSPTPRIKSQEPGKSRKPGNSMGTGKDARKQPGATETVAGHSRQTRQRAERFGGKEHARRITRVQFYREYT